MVINILLVFQAFFANAQTNEIKIYLRGVSESKISLIPLAGAKAYKPIAEIPSVKANTEAVIVIPAEYLPGEFVLR